MGKIKEIYCMGSSFTAGGGFEFEHKIMFTSFRDLYSSIGEETTLFNFSYPGQLQKLIDDDVIVHNFGKQGFGNHRTERIVYSLINSSKFDKDKTLFLIEFTALGRDEIFSKHLNDFIVCNYSTKNNTDFVYSGISKDYFSQTKKEKKFLSNYDELFKTIVENFKVVDIEVEKVCREMDFFLTYLESKSINYLLTCNPIPVLENYNKEKTIEFGDGLYFKKSRCFPSFSFKNKLTISEETNKLVEDGHCGFKANKIVANVVYNKLIELGYIDGYRKEINWKYYKKLNIFKK